MASKIITYEVIHTLRKKKYGLSTFSNHHVILDVNEKFSVFLEVAVAQYTAVRDHLFPMCEDVNSVCHISSQPSLIYSQCGPRGSIWGMGTRRDLSCKEMLGMK